MAELDQLIERIIARVDVNLREMNFKVGPYLRGLVPPESFLRFYAFCGLTQHHPLRLRFAHSALAGTHLLGKCQVEHSVLYKSDVRGDELKSQGQVLSHRGLEVPLHQDEQIHIKDSFLLKTLVHHNSQDPENPETFAVHNTASLHFANIHGSPVQGSFLGPFSTIDLTTVHDCLVGAFAYVQAGEVDHQDIEPGRVWLRSAEQGYDFNYQHDPKVLERYVSLKPGRQPTGILIDFINRYKEHFGATFREAPSLAELKTPKGAYVSRYSVLRGDNHLSPNLLVSHRAYLENAWLGKGANVQEHCYVINSRLEGYNITAHGGKLIHAHMGPRVFVGFNSFLRGSRKNPLKVGEGSIIMPHTIIDLKQPVEIPPWHMVWGFIQRQEDLAANSLPIEDLVGLEGEFSLGAMRFAGSGRDLAVTMEHRTEHILEANGAYWDGGNHAGHAQQHEHESFNIIQPYLAGPRAGLFPSMDIQP